MIHRHLIADVIVQPRMKYPYETYLQDAQICEYKLNIQYFPQGLSQEKR